MEAIIQPTPVFCGLLKRMGIVLLGEVIYYSNCWLVTLSSASISLLIFCLIVEGTALKTTTIIVDWSRSPFSSDIATHFAALLFSA